MNIGLLLIATGKYDIFIEQLLKSAHKFFLTEHRVTYHVFTDSEEESRWPEILPGKRQNSRRFVGKNTTVRYHKKKHEEWPNPTLKRYHTFVEHKRILSSHDFLFYCDIDMRFIAPVGEEVLGCRVATMHPGWQIGGTTVESREKSLAYIADGENKCYFAGGFNGGTSKEFLGMSETISKNIDKDLEIDIIAKWHDESHMNRYFVDHQPTVVLTPSYCFPQSFPIQLPYTPRLVALDKKHNEIGNLGPAV